MVHIADIIGWILDISRLSRVLVPAQIASQIETYGTLASRFLCPEFESLFTIDVRIRLCACPATAGLSFASQMQLPVIVILI